MSCRSSTCWSPRPSCGSKSHRVQGRALRRRLVAWSPEQAAKPPETEAWEAAVWYVCAGRGRAALSPRALLAWALAKLRYLEMSAPAWLLRRGPDHAKAPNLFWLVLRPDRCTRQRQSRHREARRGKIS